MRGEVKCLGVIRGCWAGGSGYGVVMGGEVRGEVMVCAFWAKTKWAWDFGFCGLKTK